VRKTTNLMFLRRSCPQQFPYPCVALSCRRRTYPREACRAQASRQDSSHRSVQRPKKAKNSSRPKVMPTPSTHHQPTTSRDCDAPDGDPPWLRCLEAGLGSNCRGVSTLHQFWRPQQQKAKSFWTDVRNFAGSTSLESPLLSSIASRAA